MRLLVAPLNWGLGHATRCIPLIHQYLADGNEVVLAGDGESLALLHSHFPTLPVVHLAPLNLHYSSGTSQIGTLLLQLPKVLCWLLRDRRCFKQLLRHDHYDLILSDNRFALYPSAKHSILLQRSGLTSDSVSGLTSFIYLTHQLHIMLPRGFRWLEPLATRLHAHFYNKYNEIWVPDYPDYSTSLAGALSHLPPATCNLQPATCNSPWGVQPATAHGACNLPPATYIAPLSRFHLTAKRSDIRQRSGLTSDSVSGLTAKRSYDTVALLSGIEPQRTIFEQEILARFQQNQEPLILIRGLVKEPATSFSMGNIQLYNHIDDQTLASLLRNAKVIIARSGYSTIMDLHALGVLDKAELHPTPGQPEQEYLAQWLTMRTKFDR